MFEMVFTAIALCSLVAFIIESIIESVSAAVKKRKHGKCIPIKPYPNTYGWIIASGILSVFNAVLTAYSLKYSYDGVFINKIKILCYLLIVCVCILSYSMQMRAYLTEDGILHCNSFFPAECFKYLAETSGGGYIIKLYTQNPKLSYTYLVKNKEAVSVLEMNYDKADGRAPEVKFKSGTVKHLLTLAVTSLIVFGGVFAWYEIQKPFVFVKNAVLPADTEWAMFSNAGYFDLMFTDDVYYYDDINGKQKEMNDNHYHLDRLIPEDLIVLKELPNLKHLDVVASDIDDLTAIGELAQLEGLAIGGGDMFAKPRDYSPLKKLTKIKYFFGFGLYNFNDLTVFENADDLSYFKITYADIQSGLDVICEKENLLILDMGGCTAEDFSPIGNCRRLKELSLSGSNATDLSFLENLKELEDLNISDVEVEDYSVLLELPSLRYLSARGSNIPDEIINKLTEKGVKIYN